MALRCPIGPDVARHAVGTDGLRPPYLASSAFATRLCYAGVAKRLFPFSLGLVAQGSLSLILVVAVAGTSPS